MTNAQEYESLEQVIKTNPKQEAIQYFIDEVGEYTVENVGEWKGGLCSCFDNIYPSMYCSYFCTNLYLSLLYSKLTNNKTNLYKCLTIFFILNGSAFYFDLFTSNLSASYTIFFLSDLIMIILAINVRIGIRNVKKIPGSDCEDILLTIFCTPCSIAQSGRTLNEYEKICECV